MPTLNLQRISSVLLLSVIVCSTAHAGSTKSFSINSVDNFLEGNLNGASVDSTGILRAGTALDRIELQNVAVASSIVLSKKGIAYIGTGSEGIIYRLHKGKISTFANTGELMVPALAIDPRGHLYAATIPSGVIYEYDSNAKLKNKHTLPDTEHVWDLIYDSHRKAIVAVTGPKGKVFELTRKNKVRLIADVEDTNLMCVESTASGALYTGSSEGALLYRIDRKNQVEVAHDFEADELTSIAHKDGNIAVIANDFSSGANHKKDTKPKPNALNARASKPRPPKTGKGTLWLLEKGKRSPRKLFEQKSTYFTQIKFGDANELLVATGQDGRVYQVEKNETYRTIADVEEKSIQAFVIDKSHTLIVTGDVGAIYREADSKKGSQWSSKVLDATFASTWGSLEWRGQGKINFETRSGPSEQVDDAWSPWTKIKTSPSKIQSPRARYLQIRALFSPKSNAKLYALQAYYLPENQPATITEVKHEKLEKSAKKLNTSRLLWKVDNPDKDALRFRLRFRQEKQRIWRPMFGEDTVLSDPKYDWDTSKIPDGHYIVEVEASDETANPRGSTLRSIGRSNPILIDNHAPRIENLSTRKGRIRGKAIDSVSSIKSLRFAVDGGPWQILFPKDRLFDGRIEDFELLIGKDVPKNASIVAIHATDAADNGASSEITLRH